MTTDTFFARPLRLFSHLRSRYREMRTNRLIGKLPAHIRKDIGWVDDPFSAGHKPREPWSSF